jgi:hypothetical protein
MIGHTWSNMTYLSRDHTSRHVTKKQKTPQCHKIMFFFTYLYLSVSVSLSLSLSASAPVSISVLLSVVHNKQTHNASGCVCGGGGSLRVGSSFRLIPPVSETSPPRPPSPALSSEPRRSNAASCPHLRRRSTIRSCRPCRQRRQTPLHRRGPEQGSVRGAARDQPTHVIV